MKHMPFNPSESISKIADTLFHGTLYDLNIIYNDLSYGFTKPNSSEYVLFDTIYVNEKLIITIHGSLPIDVVPYYFAHGIAHAVTKEMCEHSKEFYVTLKTILDHYEVFVKSIGQYNQYFPDYSSFEKRQSIEYRLLQKSKFIKINESMNIHADVESTHVTRLIPRFQDLFDEYLGVDSANI